MQAHKLNRLAEENKDRWKELRVNERERKPRSIRTQIKEDRRDVVVRERYIKRRKGKGDSSWNKEDKRGITKEGIKRGRDDRNGGRWVINFNHATM